MSHLATKTINGIVKRSGFYEDDVPQNSEPTCHYEKTQIELPQISNGLRSAVEEKSLAADYFKNTRGKTSLVNLACVLKTSYEYKEKFNEGYCVTHCTFGAYTVWRTQSQRSTCLRESCELMMINLLKHVCGVLQLKPSQLNNIQYTYNRHSIPESATNNDNTVSIGQHDSDKSSTPELKTNLRPGCLCENRPIIEPTSDMTENSITKLSPELTSTAMSIELNNENNSKNVYSKENSHVDISKLEEDIQNLKIANKTLTEKNIELNKQIEALAQIATEFESRQTNRSVESELSMLKLKVHHLETQKLDEMRIQNMQKEIDFLKMKLTKTNDDVIGLKSQLKRSSSEIPSPKAKIEKMLEKFKQHEIRMKDIEKNVTENRAQIHRTDQTINIMVLTGLAEFRVGIKGEPTLTSPQQFSGHVHPVSSSLIAETTSSQTLTNVSLQSRPHAFAQSQGVAQHQKPRTPPPPPSATATAAVRPAPQIVYSRIPITDDLLKTVKLKPPSERQSKTKLTGRDDITPGLIAKGKATEKQSQEATRNKTAGIPIPPPPPPPPPSSAFAESQDQKASIPIPPPPPPPSATATATVRPAPQIIYSRIPITDDLLKTVKLKPPSERQSKTKLTGRDDITAGLIAKGKAMEKQSQEATRNKTAGIPIPPPPPPPPPPSSSAFAESQDQKASIPIPPPPPPSSTAVVPPTSQKIYCRPPMSDELLKTVKLKPPSDQPQKIKLTDRSDMMVLIAQRRNSGK